MADVEPLFPSCVIVRCRDSDEWREERRRGVGGSDVAAILGLSRYSSPYQVWLDKVEGIHDDISGKPSVEWGNILEPVIADHYAGMHPDTDVIEPDYMLRSKERPWAQASLDRVIRDPELGWGVLEIKTAGFRRADDWDDGVPVYYQTQVQHYMDVAGVKFADVAVLIGGQDYREYRVMRDEEDAETIRRAVDSFWHDHVEAGLPPDVGVTDSPSVFAAHDHGSGEYVQSDTTPTLVSRYLLAVDEKHHADDEVKRWGAKVREAIGDSDGIACPDGRMTWRRYERSTFDRRAFDRDHPGETDSYMTSKQVDGGLVWRPARGEK